MNAVIQGVRLEVRHIGTLRPGAPAIVFLHEALGSVSLWRDFPDRLAAAAQLPGLVYSRRGHGASEALTLPRPNSYLEDESAVLGALLASEGITRPILYGHSDGAAIALVHAATAPVRGAVLEAPHVFVEARTMEAVARVRDGYRTTGLRERLQRHHGENTDALFSAWADTWTAERFRSWSIERYLPQITAPLLLIQGLDDPYTGMVQLERIEAQVRGRVEELALPGVGHIVHREQPDAVIERAARFIAGLAET